MRHSNTPTFLSIYKDSKGQSTLSPKETKFSIEQGQVYTEVLENKLLLKDVVPANRKAKRMQKRRSFNFRVQTSRNKTRTKMQKASRRANRS